MEVALVGIVSWVIVEALVNRVASLLAGSKRQLGWPESTCVGIIGALLGGLLFSLLTGRPTGFDSNVGSIVMATVGALALLFITLRLARRS